VSWDWQQLVALLCVAAALFVLGRRGWRLWKGASRPGCGTCAACPVHEGSTVSQTKPLVALDLRVPGAGNGSAEGNTATRHDGSVAR
jgi:hypothetical protein